MKISVKKIHNGDYGIEIDCGKYSSSTVDLLMKHNLWIRDYYHYLNSKFTVKWINLEPYFLNQEDAEKVVEYLETLIITQKLIGEENPFERYNL